MTEGVAVSAEVAARGVRVEASFPRGQVTALVGPNGSGKSTLVQLVSGQLRPDAGTVRIDGAVVSGEGRHVPPFRRTIALLEQRPLLFPHLSVLENVAFGVRARGASRDEARRRALIELDAVSAAGFADRRPGALSGGEQQRVALARALATDPRVLLLDEPFAALDVGSSATIRQLLASRLAARQDPQETAGAGRPGSVSADEAPGGGGATVLLVTHDPLDVWALADRVVALQAGHVAAAGEVADVLGRPSNGFLAELSGTNLLRGVPDGEGLAAGSAHVAGLWDASRPPHPGRDALATFPPAGVALFREAPHGSPRNTWPVRVSGLDPRGATVRVLLELADGQRLAADLTAQGVAALGVRPGDSLLAQVKATQVTLYAR